jgi:sulfur carrier protein
MRVVVNGSEMNVDPPCTIAALVEQVSVPHRAYAVEVNREVVPRATHPVREVREGDRVEIVTLVGGG